MSDYPELMTRDLPEGIRLVDGGVTATPGFRAGSIACGVKSADGTPDLALLVADRPCITVGTFTTNRTPAHTVLVCKEHLVATNNIAQAVVINSGNANCSNGERGMRDARTMTELAAQRFGLDPQQVLVSSTGIIGRFLPMEKITAGIRDVQVGDNGGPAFAQGIMTTDTRPKTIAVEFEVGGVTVRLGGSTKGVGMIYPNMATMLCYLTTNVAADRDWLQAQWRAAVNDSFNMVCVDGDMSTNDTVLMMANGLAGNRAVTMKSADLPKFQAAVDEITYALAELVVKDGEGATKLIEVIVKGCRNERDAEKAAFAVANSSLVKTAIYGNDANWGRIICAVGYSGIPLK